MSLRRGVTTAIKPGLWALSPGLVAPEWRGIWGHITAAWLMWDRAGDTVRDVAPGHAHPMTRAGGQATGSPSWSVGPLGRGLRYTNASNDGVGGASVLTGYPYTLLFFGVPDDTASKTAIAQVYDGDLDQLHNVFISDPGGGATWRFARRNNDFNGADASPADLTAGAPHMVAARGRASLGELWVNGRLAGTNTATVAWSANINRTSVGYLDRAEETDYWEGIVYWAAVCDTWLPAGYIRALARDPFGPFRRANHMVAAAGGGATESRVKTTYLNDIA